jgi:catechol 2,3-dioxygenase-like lactoylglutathione lyase family enzyme
MARRDPRDRGLLQKRQRMALTVTTEGVSLMTGANTHISGVGRVIVPVSDQDRALEFYLRALGMEQRTDAPAPGGGRWIEVAPAGATTVLALVQPRGGMFGHPGIDTRISLSSGDVEADHAALRGAGVDVDGEILRLPPPAPPMFFFRDPDRNILQVVQA